jgi:hypothetical protein
VRIDELPEHLMSQNADLTDEDITFIVNSYINLPSLQNRSMFLLLLLYIIIISCVLRFQNVNVVFLESKTDMESFVKFVDTEASASNMLLVKLPLVRIPQEHEDLMRSMVEVVTQPYVPATSNSHARIESVGEYDF